MLINVLQKLYWNIFIVFVAYGFRGCDIILLQNLVRFFFIFAVFLLLIFVFACQKLGNKILKG